MVGLAASSVEPTVAVKFLSAGSAACIADLITFPLDVAKVRLQIQGEGSSGKAPGAPLQYRGMLGTILTISKQEGPLSLYNGLNAGLQRQACFATIRLGLYDPVKAHYARMFGTHDNFAVRVLAGLTTGGIGVTFAQPTDVVKIRMQAQVTGKPKRYTGAWNAYTTIYREEGVKGLWKGILPNIARNSIINAAELACYDTIKTTLVSKKWMTDNFPCHFVSAFGAGFCATVIASPVDVVKTRFMNAPDGMYRGALDCAWRMYSEKGFSTFYKGFTPSFMRLGSWNICMFVTFEQLKRLFTLMTQKEHIV